MQDLLGFDHAGVSWSWPEYDDLEFMTRPAHAHADTNGVTACGETWPHTYDPKRRRVVRAPAPNEPKGFFTPGSYVPSPTRVEEIRWAEDRTRFLCQKCLAALQRS